MRACFPIVLLIGLLIPAAALRYADPPPEPGQPARVAAIGPALAMTTVVVASRDVAPRELLRAEALREVAWPVDALPRGAFTTVGELLGDGSARRRARHAILPGEPVLRFKISGPGGRESPGRIGFPGKPAASVRVSMGCDVTGMLLPGDPCPQAVTLAAGDPMPAAPGGGPCEPAATARGALETRGLLEPGLRAAARLPALAGAAAHLTA